MTYRLYLFGDIHNLHVRDGEGRFCADVQASATVNSGAVDFVRTEI